jgi:hypothetical protein
MANYASGLMNKFLAGKTIQRPYNYYVSIENMSPYKDNKKTVFRGNLEILQIFETSTNFPIDHWHAKSVTMPLMQTKFEMYNVGSLVQRHPMFDFESPILKIDFMEDSKHTIQKFLTWMSKRRMNGDGEYYPISQSACIDIVVIVTDDNGNDVSQYRFKKCSLANATELNYTYDSSEPINISVDFSFNMVEQIYY